MNIFNLIKDHLIHYEEAESILKGNDEGIELLFGHGRETILLKPVEAYSLSIANAIETYPNNITDESVDDIIGVMSIVLAVVYDFGDASQRLGFKSIDSETCRKAWLDGIEKEGRDHGIPKALENLYMELQRESTDSALGYWMQYVKDKAHHEQCPVSTPNYIDRIDGYQASNDRVLEMYTPEERRYYINMVIGECRERRTYKLEKQMPLESHHPVHDRYTELIHNVFTGGVEFRSKMHAVIISKLPKHKKCDLFEDTNERKNTNKRVRYELACYTEKLEKLEKANEMGRRQQSTPQLLI